MEGKHRANRAPHLRIAYSRDEVELKNANDLSNKRGGRGRNQKKGRGDKLPRAGERLLKDTGDILARTAAPVAPEERRVERGAEFRATQEDIDNNLHPSGDFHATRRELGDRSLRSSGKRAAVLIDPHYPRESKRALREETSRLRNTLTGGAAADPAAAERLDTRERRLVRQLDAATDLHARPEGENINWKRVKQERRVGRAALNAATEAFNKDKAVHGRIALTTQPSNNGGTMAMERPRARGANALGGADADAVRRTESHVRGRKAVLGEDKPGDIRKRATDGTEKKATNGKARGKERVEPTAPSLTEVRPSAADAKTSRKAEPRLRATTPGGAAPVAAPVPASAPSAAPGAPASAAGGGGGGPRNPAPPVRTGGPGGRGPGSGGPRGPKSPGGGPKDPSPEDEQLMDEIIGAQLGINASQRTKNSAPTGGPKQPTSEDEQLMNEVIGAQLGVSPSAPSTPAAPTPPAPPAAPSAAGVPTPPGTPARKSSNLDTRIHEKTGLPQELAAARDAVAQAHLDAARYEGFGWRRMLRAVSIGQSKYEAALARRDAAESAWDDKVAAHTAKSFADTLALHAEKRKGLDVRQFEFASRLRGRFSREIVVGEMKNLEARKMEMLAAQQGPFAKRFKDVSLSLLKAYNNQHILVKAIPTAVVVGGAMALTGGVGVIGGAGWFGWRYGRAVAGLALGMGAASLGEKAMNSARNVKGRKETRTKTLTATRRGFATQPGTKFNAQNNMQVYRQMLKENQSADSKDRKMAFIARMATGALVGGAAGAYLSSLESAAHVPGTVGAAPGAQGTVLPPVGTTPPQGPGSQPPQPPPPGAQPPNVVDDDGQMLVGGQPPEIGGRGIAPRVEPYPVTPEAFDAEQDPETIARELEREAALRGAGGLYTQPPAASVPPPTGPAAVPPPASAPSAPVPPGAAPVPPQTITTTYDVFDRGTSFAAEPAPGTIEYVPVPRAPYTPFGKIAIDAKPGSWIWNITERGFSGDAQMGAPGDSRFLSLDRAQKDFFLDAYAKNLDAHLKTLTPAQLKDLGFRNPNVNLAAWPGDTLDLSHLNNQELYDKTMAQVDQLTRLEKENILRYRGWTPAQIAAELTAPRLAYMPPVEARISAAGQPLTVTSTVPGTTPTAPPVTSQPAPAAPATPTGPGTIAPGGEEGLDQFVDRPYVDAQTAITEANREAALQEAARAIERQRAPGAQEGLDQFVDRPYVDAQTAVTEANREEALQEAARAVPNTPGTIDTTAAEEAARAGSLEGERALERANAAASYADEIQRGMERSARIAELEGEIRRTADAYYTEDLRSMFDVPQGWLQQGEDGALRFGRTLGWRDTASFLRDSAKPNDVAEALRMSPGEIARLRDFIENARANYGITINDRENLATTMQRIARAHATAALIEP